MIIKGNFFVIVFFIFLWILIIFGRWDWFWMLVERGYNLGILIFVLVFFLVGFDMVMVLIYFIVVFSMRFFVIFFFLSRFEV